MRGVKRPGRGKPVACGRLLVFVAPREGLPTRAARLPSCPKHSAGEGTAPRTMARCVKTPTKDSSQRQLSPLKAAQDHKSPIKQPPRRRLGGAGCFRRCAPPRTEGLHDDLDGTPTGPATPPEPADPPRLMDAIAAYNKLMDAEEALVEVVGLDGLRRHRRRRDVSARAEINISRRRPPRHRRDVCAMRSTQVVDEDRACDKPCWGLDDFEDDYPPAFAECPIS